VNETAEDFQPRRDGWFEHDGTWGEVTVGTVIGTEKRSQRWEVIATAHGPQVRNGYTLFMRVREQTSGDEHTIQPRMKTARVTILTQDPGDTKTAPPTEPTDTEAILSLIETLGAVHLATRDDETGEITCPDYAYDYTVGMAAEIEHLRLGHGIDVSQLNGLSTDDFVRRVTELHGNAHTHPDGSGFPHRHVPEDLAIFTGKKA
jgi:hypothetical protein